MKSRLLIVDDNRDIHDDIKKILQDRGNNSQLDSLETSIFGASPNSWSQYFDFEIDSAYQGLDGLHLVRQSLQENRPYALAVVDMRMPPGWNGIETIQHLWAEDPDLQIIVCTAHSDHSWSDIVATLDTRDRLLILKKPFDNIEIRQMAHALTQKRLLRDALMRANESRYRVLYDDNPAMFFTLDADLMVVSANRFGASKLGYEVGALVGMYAQALYEPSEWHTVHLRLNECFTSPDGVKRWETCRKRCDGSVLWVRETARVVRDPDGLPSLLLVCEDISESRRLHNRLAYEASHDALTGLLNRRSFESELNRLLTVRDSTASPHIVCYIDLDQFKVINDTCGHPAGDELLRQVAEILKSHVRHQDVLARLGGDEFGVLFQHCPLEIARDRVQHIHRDIESFRFDWKQDRFKIGTCIGLVSIAAGEQNLNDVLSAADTACYVAKNGGRNRIHVWAEDDPIISRHQFEMAWVNRFNHALDKDRLRLHYQTIMPIGPDLEQGEHLELLVRLVDEDGGIVMPGAFLPSVEHYDLSPQLDGWVFETTVRWLMDNPEIADRMKLCAINLSGRSIVQKDFVDFLHRELKKKRDIASRICFEITETAAITNLAAARDFALRLQELGCCLALDDFGSGASSFAYLKSLPVDFLKIDGMFVRGMATDVVDEAIVTSVHEVARVMGKKTIAEFVEDEAILKALTGIGVNYAQGYHIHKPAPIDRFAPSAVSRAAASPAQRSRAEVS